MLKNIKHVFFDLDHTLWDFDTNSGYAYAKIFSLHNIEIDLGDFLKIYEPINFQYWKWYREERVTKKQLRYGRLKKSFDKMNMSFSDDVINRLAEDYITFLPDNNLLFDGAIEILDYLNSKYELHIITNGFEEVQTKKLANSKIADYFKTITTSESVGVKKPNPKVFYKAMGDAGTTALHSVMIGDTYEADILGAHGVGMASICFNYHKATLPKEQLFVDYLLDIKNFL